MIFVDFCKGPKGFWVGCAEFQNGRAFASGRTLDILLDHIKTMVYRTWKISARNVMLSSRQMEVGEFQAKHFIFMSPKFKGKFWNETPKRYQQTTKYTTRNKKSVIVDGNFYDSISEAEEKLGLKGDTLGQALRHNQTTTMGHTIAYAKTNQLLEEKTEEKQEITGKIRKDTPKFTYEEKDGVLYVYETKLVAKFEVYGEKDAK